MISARPVRNSERFRQRLSTVEPRETCSGLREFQLSSAARTFRIAVSLVNGGASVTMAFGCVLMMRSFLQLLLLPASAERPVKLNETLVLRAARPREREFSRKQRPLAVQDFEIRGGAARITQVRQANRFL